MMTVVVPYTFRQDADYSYFIGYRQPDGMAVLGSEIGLCMFMPEASSHDVLWQGEIAGAYVALEIFKAEKAYPVRKLHEILPDLIQRSVKVFHNVQTATPTYMCLEAFQRSVSHDKVKDLSVLTHHLRLIKSPAEIKLMGDSTSSSCQVMALLQTIMLSKAYPDEGILSAKMEYDYRIRGAQRMAFNPVVGGGSNGSVIHYSRNDKREELYDLILQTNKECVKLCKLSASIRAIHNHSVEMLSKGFKEIGILKNETSSSYHLLNPTSIGHYLGMDVHDCSLVSYDRPLELGVVIFIESGVYIPSSYDGAERYKGIGIRIEDEILITKTGHEVLTASLPKETKQIESML